jgi:hypothetical protein
MPFLRPISDRYFEDYVEGDVHHFDTSSAEEKCESTAFVLLSDGSGRSDDPLLGRLTQQLTKDQFPVLLEYATAVSSWASGTSRR